MPGVLWVVDLKISITVHKKHRFMGNLNWLSLVVAALIPLVVGFIWYHKAVFGKAWMAASGMTEEKARQGNMALIFGLTVVFSVFVSFFFLNNVNALGQEGEFDTFKHGAFHGVLVGFMIGVPVLAINALFEQRSFKYILINAGYWIVSFALIGGVMDAMNHWN
jgi:hypothetical protein